MVDFQSPAVLAADGLALSHSESVICGVYIWEFFTSLNYDIDIYTGKRPWKWTMWPYLISRWSILAATIVIFVGAGAARDGAIDCTIWVKMIFLWSYLGVCMASLLIAVRACAIWNRHWTIVCFAGASFVAQLALQIRSLVVAHGIRDPYTGVCSLSDSASSGLPILAAVLGVDITLLGAIMFGLYLRHDSRSFGLGRMMWRQGVVWIAVATVAEVPTVVFLALDLNLPLNIMFLTPEMVILSIAATRLYRSLTEFLVVRDESWVSPGATAQNRFSAALSRRRASAKPAEIPLASLPRQSISTDAHDSFSRIKHGEGEVSYAP